MIEDGAFSHKIDYVTSLTMALNSNKQLCLKGKKKNQKIIGTFLFFTRIQRKDYCYLTELHVF